MFDLAHPLALLLLPLPLVMRLLPRAAIGGALEVPPTLAAAARPATAHRRLPVLAALCWAALVLALAGPERLVPTRDTSATGRDIILALDMSGSMLTEDFSLDGQQISRLDAVKRVAKGFVLARGGDRIGLVLFADRAYVAAPPTFDLTAVGRAIDEASIGITGRSTAIADGLGLALKRLSSDAAQTRIIVLLSDGRDTSNRVDATQVAALAVKHGVRVHTIALGPEDLETRPAARDAVDTATLRAIADRAGGQAWRVRQMSDLAAMSEELDRLEPNPGSRPPVIVPQPLWIWPAMLALGAAAVLGIRGAE